MPSPDSHSQTCIGDGSARAGVWVKTFGCQMNVYDTEKMLGILADTFRSVEKPEDAELLLVNTCSVREKAEHKLYSVLGTLTQYKKRNSEVLIGVTGCVAQQEGEHILKQSPNVDFVVGTHNVSLIPGLIAQCKAGEGPQVAIDYREEWDEIEDPGELGSSPKALVAIQRGCDKMCSFCVVPTTRGAQLSRAPEEIERELRLKVRLGAKEVLLLGQTVNSYGFDLSPRVRFEDLIRRLARIDGLERIRFTSPHPAEVRPGFIELYREIPELCPHIHLPLQSGSDRILKAMNRNYRRGRYMDIVSDLKTARPDIAITADIIVGFPTETEAEFCETLDALHEVRYAFSYSFVYSPRPHTRAAEAFTAKQLVPLELAKERLQRYQSAQDAISLEVNQEFVGSTTEVLVEGANKKISSSMRGRNPQNINVEVIGENAAPGDITVVTIDRATPHGLRGNLSTVAPMSLRADERVQRSVDA